MVRKIGRSRNFNDTATKATIVLNSTTSTIIQAANSDRIFFSVNNISNKGVWIKFQAASVDNDQDGQIFLPGSGSLKSAYIMEPDEKYTGEISAIAVSGTPSVVVGEY